MLDRIYNPEQHREADDDDDDDDDVVVVVDQHHHDDDDDDNVVDDDDERDEMVAVEAEEDVETVIVADTNVYIGQCHIIENIVSRGKDYQICV